MGLDQKRADHTRAAQNLACRELHDVWKLVTLDNYQVGERLISLVSALDLTLVEMAWYPQTRQWRIKTAKNMREMVYHQVVYQPFALLLMAAIGENGFEEETYKVMYQLLSLLTAEIASHPSL